MISILITANRSLSMDPLPHTDEQRPDKKAVSIMSKKRFQLIADLAVLKFAKNSTVTDFVTLKEAAIKK